ncbi:MULTISPECIES: hypothetical protein [Clostridium]|uniref:hypothetical protein n=1 Tax=Clostridium TaxID=1485 RepID=UPI000826C1CB|nr:MULTISPECIES: hypothetical protein [Clostridium]PJI06628.1 hypothetical protein CUB90_01540 [Clostridium sp. CT7]
MNVIKLLEYLADIIDTSSKVPLSGKVMINKKEVLNILTQIMSELPEELKKSQWILTEKDRILNDSIKEAEAIKQKNLKVMQMQVDKHSITLEADKKARKMVEDAEKEAREIKLSALHYAADLLSQLDSEIEIRENKFNEQMQIEAQKFSVDIKNNFNGMRELIKKNIDEIR